MFRAVITNVSSVISFAFLSFGGGEPPIVRCDTMRSITSVAFGVVWGMTYDCVMTVSWDNVTMGVTNWVWSGEGRSVSKEIDCKWALI